MRPLRLEIRGFTAFRDEQEIDFESVETPFAIVGQTGSGKSSILDAMTYALYGQVDRVDERSTREMITQGQPSMAVEFEFEVGDERYRVTRRTPRTGATKILVQRVVDGGWEQAGEGADRVKDANRLLERAIGLDFDGFTRSVMLPQGKFSAFMSGDPRRRREILTDLLGLGRFLVLGQQARQIASAASGKAGTYDEMIATRYADATPEALEASRAAVAEASTRQEALAAAAASVAEVADRWKTVHDAARELRICAAETESVAAAVAGHAARLESLAAEASTAGEALRAASEASTAAAVDAAAARTAVEGAEREWGTAADLARVGERARALAAARNDLQRRTAEAAGASARIPVAAGEAETAEASLGKATSDAEAAKAGLAAAAAGLREVEHRHTVAALVGALKVGDPCPVCGDPLQSIPSSPGDRAVEAALRAEERARRTDTEMAHAVVEAGRALDRARDAAAAAEKEAQRAQAEVDGCELMVRELETAIREALGDLPSDPAASVQERLDALQRLAAVERRATERAVETERALQRAAGLRDRIAADAGAARAGLAAVSLAGVGGRAGTIDGALVEPGQAELPGAADLPALATAATERATTTVEYAKRLSAEADRRAGSEPGFLREATELAGELIPPQRSLPDLAAAMTDAVHVAIREHEQRSGAVDRLEGDLEKVAALRADAADLRERGRVFQVLATELRADRLIAFLQQEALQLLAVGGSNRLASLSGGRYELRYEGDEFLVVDRWNGDETRSVRTLSGGETFLASLALALALAEQVSSLAVTKHASLDSLFLDEGFGTLDPETLETVIDAVEHLGGDGRVVGVITHVRELADRMPARIEIEKTQRGSRIRPAS
ncbi:MAG TPA: SMC family ATPase [Actinomycetota bacterium]